ncbi:hypothetical protein ACFL3I_10670 [Pseudomonadota bacterium]
MADTAISFLLKTRLVYNRFVLITATSDPGVANSKYQPQTALELLDVFGLVG